MPASRIDTDWFTAKLADRQMSQRQLAKRMGVDPSAVSLMFRGRREMRMTEAAEIANLLGVPVAEVLQHAGLEVDSASNRTCPIVGFIGGEGEVYSDWSRETDRAPCPPDAPKNTVALQYRTTMTRLELVDGWIVFTTPPQGLDPDAVNRLCVVKIRNGVTLVRHLRRGYKPRTYNLIDPFGAVSIDNADVEWATPVVEIRTR